MTTPMQTAPQSTPVNEDLARKTVAEDEDLARKTVAEDEAAFIDHVLRAQSLPEACKPAPATKLAEPPHGLNAKPETTKASDTKTERTSDTNLGIPVLNQGFVRLDAACADDLSVVNAARVSFGKRRAAMDQSDVGLVRFLMTNRHGTPFEHNVFRFHIRCPIFVAREWFRHRIASYNEFSMRYAKAQDDWYVPAVEDVRTQVGKPGAYKFEPLPKEQAETVREAINKHCQDAFELYNKLLAQGVAKELARTVLPVGAFTEFYFTVNARSLMNFVSLRNDPTALREIRMYAEAVERIFAAHMPVTHAAFVAAARVPP